MRTDGKHNKRYASLLKLNELSVVAHPAQEGALVGIIKSAQEAEVINKEDGLHMDDMDKKLTDLIGESKEDIVKSVKEMIEKAIADERKAIEKSLKEKKEPVKKATDDFVEIDGQKIAKSALTPEVESLMKSFAEKNAQAEQKLAVMQKEMELAACVKEAETKFSHLSGDPIEKGKVVYALKSLDDESRTYIEKALSSADSVMGEKFKFVGSSYGSTEVNKSKDNSMDLAIASLSKRMGYDKEAK